MKSVVFVLKWRGLIWRLKKVQADKFGSIVEKDFEAPR